MTQLRHGVVHVPYLLLNERTCKRDLPTSNREDELVSEEVNLIRSNDRQVFVHVPTKSLYVEDGVDSGQVEGAIARADAALTQNYPGITTIIPPS